MKKYLITIILLIIPIFLIAELSYLSEEEYKDLSKKERLKYWDNLENEVMMWQQREADAKIAIERNEKELKMLEQDIENTDAEYENLMSEITAALGVVSHGELVEFQNQLNEIRSKLDYYGRMPDSDLYNNNKEILAFIDQYKNLKGKNIAKVPKFSDEFTELDRSFEKLEDDLENARPKYYEDTHIVVKNEYLYKISGYQHIYNDPTKWGIIYRANRDQIKDPDLIYPDQVLKIPKGLPTTWKVYRGECLWTISSYPEIYDDPFKWPEIFRANTDQIEDPDLIYPNQILRIPRN